MATPTLLSDSKDLGNFLGKPVRIAIIVLMLIVILFPFYWLISNALKTSQEYFATPPIFLPHEITLKNFVQIFTQDDALKGLVNSLLISGFATIITVVGGTMAAYSLINGALPKRLKFVMATWFLVQKMYPAVVVAVPVFFVVQRLGLMDTRLSLIIMNTSFNLPLVILLMIGFYSESPFEIEEQALIDGCNLFQRYFWVTSPMVKSGMIAVGILTFISTWNEFLFAVILTNIRATPVTVIITGFITDKGLEWGPMAAMGCAVILPVLLIMWFAQKNFVSGVSAGAPKGELTP